MQRMDDAGGALIMNALPQNQEQGLALLEKTGRASATFAVEKGAVLGAAFQKYMQEGPQGVSFLCMCAGLLTVAVAILNVLDFMDVLFTPFTFVLNVYMVLFGSLTVALEADPARMKTVPLLENFSPQILEFQHFIHDQAKILTLLLGRGVFYLFMGLLMLSECWFCLYGISGCGMVLMGLICIGTSFGWKTDKMAAKYLQLPAVSVEADFPKARQVFESSPSKKKDVRLKALLKQIERGNCEEERPSGFWSARQRAEHDAWTELTGMGPDSAKFAFVQECREQGMVQ